MTPNTDAPDADTPNADGYDAAVFPNAAYDDAAYPKSIHLSLRNRNIKIAPNTKETTKIT